MRLGVCAPYELVRARPAKASPIFSLAERAKYEEHGGVAEDEPVR
jgi:hypothetical protein